MKIRGVILATCALMVFWSCYAMANEPYPEPVSSAKPVMVPYLNKTINEVKNEHRIITDGNQQEADGDQLESVEDSDAYDIGAVLTNAGRMEEGQALPELVESGDDEARLQGSVDEYAGLSEDGHSDGYADESEVESEHDGDGSGDTDNPVLTYLGTYTATAYCSCSICTGVYSTGYTASGTWATEGRTVACNVLPFGTQIYIEGYGYYIVEDTGWSPYGEAWLDLFYSSHDSALAFGVRNVEVYLVN